MGLKEKLHLINSGNKRTKLLGLTGLMILIVALCGCMESSLNSNPPSYIKDVTTYKEGIDGLAIYFILADSSGQMTTSDGKANMNITLGSRKKPLYSRSFNVIKSNFVNTKVGIGAFEHEAIICYLGRITYGEMGYKQKGDAFASGKVLIEFITPDGKVLKGEDTVYF